MVAVTLADVTAGVEEATILPRPSSAARPTDRLAFLHFLVVVRFDILDLAADALT